MGKKIIAFFLVFLILTGYGNTALAGELVSQILTPDYETEFQCGTDPELQLAMSSTLVSKKADQIHKGLGADTRSIVPEILGQTLMPSTGDVKILVLPIDFEGYRMDESLREELAEYFNTEYDKSLEGERPFVQSVRGAFEKLSYGRLNLTADVLPIYHAEYDPQHYGQSRETVRELVRGILKSYIEDEIIDPSDYDSNCDGVVDGVAAKFYLEKGQGQNQGGVFGDYQMGLGMKGFSGCTFTPAGFGGTSIWDDCETDAHEIGHMMGLPDRYDYEQQFFLDYGLADFMTAGMDIYLNVYDKFLLGWIDPVVLTNDDAPRDLDLYAVETYSKEDGPKAVALIPDPLMFPFSEFFIAEYRNASQRSSTTANDYSTKIYGHPGVVLWHCDTELVHYGDGDSGWYRREKQYIQPVYRSGKTRDPDGWQQSIYDASDLYVERSFFTSTTPVNSDFYGGVYTGAYLQVKSITQEKATIKAGFQDPDLTPAPEIHISGPSKKAVQSLDAFHWNEANYTVTCTVGGEIVPFDELNDYWAKLHVITTGSLPQTISHGSTLTNPQVLELYNRKKTGEGTVYLSISDGYMTYHGKPSRAVESEVLYVDSTPPEITPLGEDPQVIERGEAYQELGAEIQDNLDPEIEDKLEIDASQVDTDAVGSYTVTYSAEDHAGNAAQASRTVIVQDTVAPEAKVEYSTTRPTGEAVTARITFSEPVTFTSNGDKLTATANPLIYTANFAENGSFGIEFADLGGNTGTAEVTVSNLDSSLPIGMVAYDTTAATNHKVIATVTVPSGVEIINNGGKEECVFTGNGSFEFKLRDSSGKVGVVTAKVDWIDTTPPAAAVEYSTDKVTNQDVTATIVPSEDVTVIGGEASYTFTENGSHTFKFSDAAGNTGSVTAAVDWIDKTPAAVEVRYAPTYPTNSRVWAVLSSEEEITILNEGELNCHEFTSNGTYTFRYQDKAGNIGSVTAKVDWIDKRGPTAQIEYSTTQVTGKFPGVTATLVPSKKVKVTNNDGSPSYTFKENGSFTFEFEDEAGNAGRATAVVNNIESGLFLGVANYDPRKDAGPTTQNVTVTFTRAPGTVILNNDGNDQYTFTENGIFEFLGRDKYGNEGVFFTSVDWIDKTPPTAEVSYTPDTLTNGEVTAAVTFSEPVTLTSGGDKLKATWKPLVYEAVFPENGSFDFTFQDQAGNVGETGTVKVDWIDKSAPTAEIEYSVTGPTNQDVTAVLVPSKDVTVTSLGGESHTFVENGSFTFTFEDAAGNAGAATAKVDWIDKTPPTATVKYSTAAWTNQEVTAVITPSEEVTETGGSLTHTFTENGFYTVELTDAAGNTGEAVAVVDWIDRKPPVIKLNGANPQTILCGEAYTELGAMVTDDLDESIPSEAVIDASAVDTSKVGRYTVTYAAVDHVGNRAEAVREVIVEEVHTHTLIQTEAKAATCTEEGNLEYWTCSGCGSVFADAEGTVATTTAEQVIAKLPHDYKEVVTAPTCTTGGYTTHTCSRCRESYTDNETKALGHDLGEWTERKEATCTGTGLEQRSCSRCEYSENRVIPVASHVPGEWEVDTPATAEYEGVQIKKCTVCGVELERESIPKLSPSDPPTPPTPPGPGPVIDPKPVDWRNPFADVKQGDWFYDSVRYVCENGMMAGLSTDEFGPNTGTTRGMIVAILWRKEGKPESIGTVGFTDVKPDQYYSEAIRWAVDHSIASGYDNEKFGPDDPITREQLTVILWRYAGSPESAESLDSFTDGNKSSNYAVPALRWAVERSIVSGKGGGVLDPKGGATRAEMATMLTRYCGTTRK